MNGIAMSRALAGLAIRVRQRGPTPQQWVDALALVAAAPPIPGHYRLVDLAPGRASVSLHRFAPETSVR